MAGDGSPCPGQSCFAPLFPPWDALGTGPGLPPTPALFPLCL